MTTSTWRNQYEALLETTAASAHSRMSANPHQRLTMVFKPASVNPGTWGEFATVSQVESIPNGWEVVSHDYVPMGKTIDSLVKWIRSFHLPVINPDA